MKIFVVSYSNPLSRDALAYASVNMGAAFKESGVDTLLILPVKVDAEELKNFYQLNTLVKTKCIKILPPGARFSSFTYAIAIAGSFSFTYTKNVIFYTDHPWTAIFLSRFGKKVIFNPDTYQPYRQYHKFLIAASRNKNMLLFACMSSPLLKLFEKDGVPTEKLLLAPLGVNIDRYKNPLDMQTARKKLNLPLDIPIITLIGDLYEGRGAEILIECAVKMKNILFLLVGATQKDLERLNRVKMEKSAQNVKIENYVPPKNVPIFEWASDILVMPYTTKTLTHNIMSPLKMFEYLAAKRPIVASDFLPLRDVLIDKENAWLVPPEDVGALCKAFEIILNNPSLKNKLSENAWKTALQFTWKRRVEKILSTIDIKRIL
jgi:glycosyltransferase involved in cell wall biosynthesis